MFQKIWKQPTRDTTSWLSKEEQNFKSVTGENILMCLLKKKPEKHNQPEM